MAGTRRAAVAGLLVFGLASVVAAGGYHPEVAPARVGTRAERGGQESVVPPTYPAGPCDQYGGDLALGPGQQPDAVVQIGTSGQGRAIWAEHWGPATGPQVMIVATVHGDECAPGVFIRAARRRGETSNIGMWLIPALNPDGYAIGSRYTPGGVDLNRDGYYLSQPESQALIAFTQAVRPAISVHVHSPFGNVSAWGPPISDHAAQAVATAAGLRPATEYAFRDPSEWYLWRGQVTAWPDGGTILVEMNPLHAGEAPEAPKRDDVVSVEDAEEQASAALEAVLWVASGD